MDLDRSYNLYIQKLYYKPNFRVCGCWNKSLHLQPLQRCYCDNSGSSTSACVMRRRYCITYMQSLHVINGLVMGSFSKLSVTSPTSQLIPQPFFRLSYVSGFSLTSPGEPPMPLCVWWNFEGDIHWEFVPNGCTVDADLYYQQR